MEAKADQTRVSLGEKESHDVVTAYSLILIVLILLINKCCEVSHKRMIYEMNSSKDIRKHMHAW